MPQYGQMLDCAGAMRWLPDNPDPQDEWFEIRVRGDTFFDHDRSESTALKRAEIFCGLTGGEADVYRCTRWEYDGEIDEECIKCLAFDEDTQTVGNA